MVETSSIGLSIERQCVLLGIHRSGIYYKPSEPNQEDLALMVELDKLYMETPFYGSRRMVVMLQKQGWNVNRKRVVRLMRKMGIEAIYPKPKLSAANAAHKKYPYLMKGEKIDQPNDAWAADITYVPLLGGFGYLIAIIDWFSRYVIDWEISNLLEAEFCLETLKRSLLRKKPKIFNTDQGVQFTSIRFTGCLEENGVQISMDGRGRALDNVFIERLWRSVKYEEIYPRGYENLRELRTGLEKYFEFYNEKRPHQGLGYRTPAEVYYGGK
jgi:putative transposase